MKQVAQNTFNNGLRMDLNPLTTPSNVLTDCLNGTIITYNGNEFTLQNDMGNCQVETARLSPGFIPMGMKEYGGIIYVVSLNPITGDCEVGSFPSPQRDFSTTDFTDLSPVRFQTSQFILETNTTHELSTRSVGKLFEPELFELHPGDKYVVVYDINTPPTGTGVPINDQPSMDNYISGNPASRKLFALNFYKISDSNNLVSIPSGTIKYIKDIADLESEYVYYPEPANSVLAVALELEPLDEFEASVVDASLKTNSNKKVGIQAVGYSNSLSNFQGVKVDVTLPSLLTFYLDKGTSTSRKVSGTISGLASKDQFECTLTPYSKYNLFPKLTKKYKLTIGDYFSSGSGVNDIFQYYVDATHVRVDFDFKFQGNDPNGLHLYVEFYDPWSDYSIVRTVDNPTYYGLNSVSMELVTEPRVDLFNSVTVGGTSVNKLKVNPDLIYEKTLLNSTNMIRSDQYLRTNHFYLVRVSGIDTDVSTGVAVYTHYDFYKGLFTTTMYNDIYTNQAALSPSDPTYISDFNSLDFDISGLGYSTTVGTGVSVTKPAVNIDLPQTTSGSDFTYPLMTGDQYYVITDSPATGGPYKNQQVFETDVTYDVQLGLVGTEKVFGDFRSSLLSATFPSLIASDASGSGNKPTIVETIVPGTPLTESRAIWSVVTNSALDYTVNTAGITKRSIVAPIQSEVVNGRSYKEVSIAGSFRYLTNSLLANPNAVIELLPQHTRYQDTSNTIQHFDTTNGSGSEDLYNLVANDTTRNWSAYWGFCYERDVFLHWDGAPGDYGCTSGCTETEHRHNMLFFRNPLSGQVCACRTHSLEVAKDFFNVLKVASNVPKPLNLNYPNALTTTFNSQLTTTFQFTGAVVTTNFTPHGSLGSYIKTYLSDFRMHATSNYVEFNPTVLNAYIASRQGNSTIVDNKNTIRDGFIPFIITPTTSTSPLKLDDIIINQSCDNNILGKYRNAKAVGLQDTAFISTPNLKTHGTLFSTDPNGKYQEFVGKFGVGQGNHDVQQGVEITTNDINIYIKNANEPYWSGYFAANGNAYKYHAPNMFTDFQIT